MIPFLIHENHWVLDHQINFFFLYSDDMNSSSTESQVKQLLQSTGIPNFYPQNATWISCT